MSNPRSTNFAPAHRRYLDSVAACARNLMRTDAGMDRGTAVDVAFGVTDVPSAIVGLLGCADLPAERAYVNRHVAIR